MVAPTLSFEATLALLKPVAGPTSPPPPEVEVAIVGAGPAGLTAANLLGARCVKVAVLERNPSTADLPKAIAVDDEYMRLLDQLGLGEDMAAHTSAPFGVHFTSPTGIALARVPGFITQNGFGNRNAVSQPMFEKILLAGAQRFSNVTLCYATEVTGIVQDQHAVHLEMKTASGETRQLTAKYVLACDGARSFVCNHLGIAFEGTSLDQPHLVVDLAEVPDQVPYSRFICNPRRPLNCVLGPYGGRRIEFMLMPCDDHATIASDESIRRLVDLHTPYKGMPLKIIRRAIYGLAERLAARMNLGRVFLLGDAAHIMPPFGAQGMNSGARDAANLCWKIAGVLAGQLPVTTLATYDSERREHARQTIDYSVRISKVANVRFWPLALLRDAFFGAANIFPSVRRYFAEMRYMPKPVISKGLVVRHAGEGHSPVGRLMPRLIIHDSEGASRDIDARAGSRWALMAIDLPRDTLQQAAQAGLWQTLNPVLINIRTDATISGGDRLAGDNGREVIATASGSIIVMRPDRVIAGIAKPDAFAALSQQLQERMKSGA